MASRLTVLLGFLVLSFCGCMTSQVPRALPGDAQVAEAPMRRITPAGEAGIGRQSDRSGESEAEPDMPREAEAFRYMQRLDERGLIEPNALIQAKNQKDRMMLLEAADPFRSAGLSLGGWSWIGPGNIGGRTRAIVVHPTQTNTIWVGGISGGIWKTTNGGTNWFPLNDFLPSLAVSCMAIDPNSPNTLYAGTGEGVFGAITGTQIISSRPGAGIFKTTDGGTTWSQLSSTAPPPGSNPVLHDWGFVNRIAISPNSGVILAATNAGIFRSTDGGTNWSKRTSTRTIDVEFHPSNNNRAIAGRDNRFAAYSTDGGLSWTNVQLEPVAATTVRVASAPDGNNADDTLEVVSTANMAAGDVLLIQGAAPAQDELVCLVAVVDGDTITVPDLANAHAVGRTVNEQTYTNERVEVAYAPNDANNTVYAAWEELFCNKQTRLYRSVNGGVAYTLRDSGTGYMGTQGDYNNTIWVNPQNKDHLVVGGIDLWESTTGGTGLNKISDWTNTPTTPHADHHTFVHDPGFNNTTNRIIYSGNDGGIYKAADLSLATDTAGWASLNNGIGITQFYGAAATNASTTLIGGTQDNGTLRYTPAGGINGWTVMEGGDGGFCASDPTNANIFYGEYVLGRVYRSSDAGATASYIHAPRGCVSANGDLTAPCGTGVGCPACAAGTNAITDAINGTCNFIAPILLDPNNAARLLVGCDQLWRANDANAAQPNWFSIKATVGSNISAVAVVNGNADRMMVGHNNGRIYITKNGTNANPTWTLVNIGLPARYCSRIAFDPANSNNVFATFMGYGIQPPGGNVYRGAINWVPTPPTVTWSAIHGPGAPGDAYTLPAVPVTSIAVHPSQSGWVYIGTDIGVFASENALDAFSGAGSGPRWHVADGDPANGEGPTNCPVDHVFFRDNSTLVAATHGRGVFTATAAAPGTINRANLVSVSSTSALGVDQSDYPDITWDGRYVTFSSFATNLLDNSPATTGGRSHVYVRDRQQNGANAGTTTILSVAPDGSEGNGQNIRPRISKDGRFVVFYSNAMNLVAPASTPGRNHVYLRDRQSGQTTRVSVSPAGAEGSASSAFPDISGDGRYVVYVSAANNLIAGDTEGFQDVFVWDRLTGVNSRVSLAAGGGGAGGNANSGDFANVDISENGQFIVFASPASNLVANDTNGLVDVFRHNRVTGTTIRVNVGPGGAQTTSNTSTDPAISSNGLRVVFTSMASELVAGGTANRRHVYMRNIQTATTTRISVDFNGNEGAADSGVHAPAISPEGNWVSFDSGAQGLVAAPSTPLRNHVYLRDLVNGVTKFCSFDTTTFPFFQEGNSHSWSTALSANGVSMAFTSDASNLVAGDTNGQRDVFTFDQGCLLVTTHPVSQAVCAGQTVTMSVAAVGGGITYQWRKNGVNIGGATFPTIIFGSVALADAGSYDVVLNRGCNDVITLSAVLSVHARGSGDVDLNGVVNGRDIAAYLQILLYSPLGPVTPAFCAADMNQDGTVTVADTPQFTTKLLNP